MGLTFGRLFEDEKIKKETSSIFFSAGEAVIFSDRKKIQVFLIIIELAHSNYMRKASHR